MPDNSEDDYINPDETGLRSGKGTGFFSRFVLGREYSPRDSDDSIGTTEDGYSDPEDTGLRSGKGTGLFRRLIFR